MLNALLGLWPLLVLMVLMGGVYVVLRTLGLLSKGGRGTSNESAKGYRLKEHLLSRGELAFYRALVMAVGDRYIVMVKVRLADLVEVDGAGAGTMAARNQVIAKHVDFVLCDVEAVGPVLAIELDDATHGTARGQRADTAKDRALASAGLPLLRVRATATYAAAEIGRQVEAGMRDRGAGRAAVHR